MKTFLGIILLAASAAAADPEAALRKADEGWLTAVAAKSVERTLAFYAPGIVTAGSAMFPANGLADIRAGWTKLFAEPGFALAWKTERVAIVKGGSLAYTSGTWTSGPNERGPFLSVWQKQPDGQWKVVIDAAWMMM